MDYSSHLEDVETPYGTAHEVTLDYFTANILPPLHPHIDLESRLRKRALRRVVTKEDKWWGYSSRLPGAHPKIDFSKTYSHLERGVRMTVNAVRKINPCLMFHVNKEGEPCYEKRTATYLPDAFFVTTPVTEGPFQWEDIAVIGEFHRFEDTRFRLEVCFQESVVLVSRTYHSHNIGCAKSSDEYDPLYASGPSPPIHIRLHDRKHQNETLVR